MTSVDELELELRRLPGVLAVGLIANSELVVTLWVVPGTDASSLTAQAELLALGHHDHPVVSVVEPPPDPVVIDLEG